MELLYTSYIQLHNFDWYSWMNEGHIHSKTQYSWTPEKNLLD